MLSDSEGAKERNTFFFPLFFGRGQQLLRSAFLVVEQCKACFFPPYILYSLRKGRPSFYGSGKTKRKRTSSSLRGRGFMCTYISVYAHFFFCVCVCLRVFFFLPLCYAALYCLLLFSLSLFSKRVLSCLLFLVPFRVFSLSLFFFSPSFQSDRVYIKASYIWHCHWQFFLLWIGCAHR